MYRCTCFNCALLFINVTNFQRTDNYMHIQNCIHFLQTCQNAWVLFSKMQQVISILRFFKTEISNLLIFFLIEVFYNYIDFFYIFRSSQKLADNTDFLVQLFVWTFAAICRLCPYPAGVSNSRWVFPMDTSSAWNAQIFIRCCVWLLFGTARL